MSPITLEGQTLGKYKICEPLGRGGMAQVYKAYHPQLDRYVAVKVLRSDLVEEKEFLARFQREARSVAALRHPNIVQVYDFDTQDDLYYMVMELLEGDTLNELARKHQVAEHVISRLSNFMDAEALRAIADGVSLNLDSVEQAEASAVALQVKLRELSTTGVPAEVAGEFDARTDKPILRISRRHHGNIKSSVITQDIVHGADYAALAVAADTFRGLLGEGAKVLRGEGDKQKEEKVGDFRQAMQWLISEAERTTSRQRYKGLGEMNPAQLWETTMDPTVRRLLRVQIDDAIEADRVFTMLMGDEVEPRRDFIEANALRAGNIDV